MFLLGPTVLLLIGCVCLSLSQIEIDIKGYHKHNHNCRQERIHFSAFASQFLFCAGKNSEPVEYCRNCGEFYTNFTEHYNILLTGIDKNDNVSCKSKYFDQNRLNILENIFSSSVALWEMGSCSNCYDRSNNSHFDHLSNSTTTFFNNWTNFTECLRDFISTECLNCAGKYEKMNEVYELIKKDTQDNICFDIKDTMNKTRLHWSKELKCCKDRKTSLTAFIVMSSVISVLIPMFFYSGFLFFGWRRQQYSILLTDFEPETSGSTGLNQPTVTNDVNPSIAPQTSASSRQNKPIVTNDVNPSTSLVDLMNVEEVPSTAQLLRMPSSSNQDQLLREFALPDGRDSDDEMMS